MKIRTNLMFVIALFFLFNGCIATHVGTITGSASLSAPNFMYKKHDIYGEAQATYIFGIGGAAKQSLVSEAKKKMLASNPLKDNQALANVSVNYKTTNYLGILITTIKCHVSADIVEFGPAQIALNKPPLQKVSKDNQKENVPGAGVEEESVKEELNVFAPVGIGDRVKIINYFRNPIEGTVIDIEDETYIVDYVKSNNKVKQIKVIGFQIEKIQ